MSIVSSTYDLGHPQIDDRRYVTEQHTDHLGAVHVREYLAAVGTDYAAVLATSATQLEIDLAEAEADALLA